MCFGRGCVCSVCVCARVNVLPEVALLCVILEGAAYRYMGRGILGSPRVELLLLLLLVLLLAVLLSLSLSSVSEE